MMTDTPSWQLPWTALVVAGMIVVLARERFAPPVVVVGALLALLLPGVITPEQALAGFANPAPITIAALFVMARAVEKTGALQPLLARALGGAAGERWVLARLLAPVAAVSAFFNNTPIVAMLIAPITAWADRAGRPPSRLLLPMVFATSLGGMLTLVGTSTNLVASGLLTSRGMAPLGMFEFTGVALPLVVLGLGYLVLASPRLLPERLAPSRQFEAQRREFTLEMRVVAGGAASGLTVAAAGLRHLEGVFLGWIRRGDAVVSPVAPEEILRDGDVLGFVGNVDRVVDLQRIPGLRSAEDKHVRAIATNAHRFFQAVVAPFSPLAGQTLKAMEFRSRYQATVLAIHRAGDRIEGKLGEVTLRPGDTLLLLAAPEFQATWRDRRDFLLVAPVAGALPMGTRRARLVLGTMAVAVGLAALGLVSILKVALAAALAMVVTRTLTPAEARRAVNMDVILLIAATFGIAAGIETSGLAAAVANGVVTLALPLGGMAVLAALVLGMLLLTELLTNTAALALLFPVALEAARLAGTDPRAFVIAITLAASASFLTPIGYQTNLMVYGPGGYRFRDYIRLGLPLSLLVGAGTVLLVAITWGLY